MAHRRPSRASGWFDHRPRTTGDSDVVAGGGAGSSPGDKRDASTAYGFRTPAELAPMKLTRRCGSQPAARAAATAGLNRSR